jgi:U3 small nucleolar RNA-associated protein 5
MITAAMPKHLASHAAVGPPVKRHKKAHDTPRTDLKSAVFSNGAGKRLSASTTKIPNSLKQIRTDESRVAVAKPDSRGDVDGSQAATVAVVEISSDSSSSDVSSDDEDDEAPGEPAANGVHAKQNGHIATPEINGREERSAQSGDEAVENEEEDAVEGAEDDEPSFGEILKARDPEPIDVEAAFESLADESAALTQLPNRALAVPSANSLGTVLTQALRTNDTELLESCFMVHDLQSIRATIERTPSNLVAILIENLANRMERRPGRAGHLMVWVQWALVSHGGYLAGLPDLMKTLRALYRALSDRAENLPRWLQLKGKLDMMNAQFELRRSQQMANIDEEDDPVIYVEGEEESTDEDEDQEMEDVDDDVEPIRQNKDSSLAFRLEDSDDEEEMPLINGVDYEENAANDSESEEEGFIDDEADESEGGGETTDDEEISAESEGEDLSNSDDEPGPAKRSAVAMGGFARR